MIDLLSPVGNFECLKAAVQNGADSVYFGSNIFSARAFAHNFNLDELRKAIHYAKIRGVKTNLTLNTLIKDTEFDNAFMLAKKAYEFGIDAIIVQDLGLAKELIEKFPDLAIHASTQMTVHNLSGALELQDIGFKRIVLARELSLNEIDYICKNTNVEIECFIHGALCISYSGQCLFSSMIGRKVTEIAANALGPCRLPYELYENNKKINSGYILSTRDLCGLDYIPNLIESGVKCLKIEGRMKSAEYVATVTRIYRKYIDLALSNNEYIVDEKDRLELMQVYNRGMSSYGHLENTPNKNLVFKEKPNNMGLYLGKIQHFNKSKGLITLKLKTPVEIGDTISIENEKGTYTISELMENNKNITTTKQGQLVTIGRMKGNISVKNKVYKMSSKSLLQSAKESYKYENKKMFLNCKVTIKKDLPISIRITPANGIAIYKNLNVTYEMEDIPLPAKTKPLTKDIIINQISKTTSTPFEFKKIVVDLDDNLFLPKISTLNELRRKALEQVENYAIAHIERSYNEPQTASETNETLNTMRNYISQQPLMQKKPKIKTSL
ncbi:MAG: U32 family peptidase, partial [Clostridia bacterium]|nr:U32 family peptidase [Clostridia bacterium]